MRFGTEMTRSGCKSGIFYHLEPGGTEFESPHFDQKKTVFEA